MKLLKLFMVFAIQFCIPYSCYVVKDLVQVQKIWIKYYWNNKKNNETFWYFLKENLMWFGILITLFQELDF